mgnify:CR=1 FL=1
MIELLFNRRTIRKYKDKEIKKEVLEKILQGALTSPSSKNRRKVHTVLKLSLTKKYTMRNFNSQKNQSILLWIGFFII